MFTTSHKAGSKSLFSSVSINIKTGCSLFAVYGFSQYEKKAGSATRSHYRSKTHLCMCTCVCTTPSQFVNLLQFYKAKKLIRKVFKFTVLRPKMFHLGQYKTDTIWNIDMLGGGAHFA